MFVNMSYGDFRKLVAEMMDLQGHYFKHREPETLAKCKEVERRVRNELKGVPPAPPGGQAGLFDGVGEGVGP